MKLLKTRFDARCRSDLHFLLVLLMLTAASLSITASQIALGLSLLMLLTRRLVDKEPMPATGLGLVTLALAGWALLSIPFSNDISQSVIYYRRFYLFTTIWAVAAVADSDTRRLWLLLAMVLGSVSISVIGLVRIHREVGMPWVYRLGDLSNPMTSGALLMLALLVTMGFLLIRPQRRGLRCPLALPAVIIAFGLSQTMTRSAWLGTITGLATMLFLVRPRLMALLAVMLLAVGLILPKLPDGALSGRLSERLDFSGMMRHPNISTRLEMWQVGLRMIKDYPLLGVGDMDLGEISASYYPDSDPDQIIHGHLHNNQLTLAVIWGLPGLILAMTHLLWQWVLLLRAWRARNASFPSICSPLQQAWILGALGAWVGFFTAGLTEWYFGDAESMLLYLAIIGAALGARHGPHVAASCRAGGARIIHEAP